MEIIMPSWNSRGLRGSMLEDLINRTNERYREKKLAVIQKIPTPIKPIQIDKQSRHITLAYFDQKSTVDYIGVVQTIPVCFDAKECHTHTFPIQNIHKHQITFMTEFEQQGGVAFLLLYFTSEELFYYLTYKKMMEFVKRAREGGRKSFLLEELDKNYEIPSYKGMWIHYLKLLEMDLEERELEKRTLKKIDKENGFQYN